MDEKARHPGGLGDGKGGQFTARPLKTKSSLYAKKFMRGNREQALYIGSSLAANRKDRFMMYRQGDRVFCTYGDTQSVPKRFAVLDELPRTVYEYRAVAHRNPDDETMSVKVSRYTLGSKDVPVGIAVEEMPVANDELTLRGFDVTDPETGERITNIGMSIFDASNDQDVVEMISQMRHCSLLEAKALASEPDNEEASAVRDKILAELDAHGLSYVVDNAKDDMWSAACTRMIELDQNDSHKVVERATDASIATIARNNLDISDADYYTLAGPWLRSRS
jgi:hypothetical protein